VELNQEDIQELQLFKEGTSYPVVQKLLYMLVESDKKRFLNLKAETDYQRLPYIKAKLEGAEWLFREFETYLANSK